MDHPLAKDVVIGALGASAGLAGLVLVFLGVVIGTYQSFPGDTSGDVLKRYRSTASRIAGVFVLSLGSAALSFAWLVAGGPGWLYPWTVVAFSAQLVATLLIALYSLRVLMR